MRNFAQEVYKEGGSLHPLIIDSELTGGTGLMNPSIINDEGILRVILRHVNYTFYHSEKKLFQHPFGPLTYIHPENDIHLRTWNWYLELNDSLDIVRYDKIDTSQFDTYETQWDFVGLEDARIVSWENSLWITGVRRDTTTNGQGRMELSKLNLTENAVTEVERFRIENPEDKDSYCEKNWMPLLDDPFTFVKWSNPTEIVKVNTEVTHTDQFSSWVSSSLINRTKHVPANVDFRGGSQVLPYKDGYLAIIHEVDLFKSPTGRKDAVYRHRFLQWDKEFNLIKVTEPFSLMGGLVEFSVGMCEYKNYMLISFGFQDNAAYILKTPFESIEKLLNE